ncbi:DNA-binding protein [bacterium]|nr:DNA-binding protein [Alphaproteobacteria bacterium]NDC96053.1 DNA-binding protein [bacterium]NDD85694.1 DNA-binding protein [bacterium]NDG27208.1 DNA-binding protein [Pseudomonadota bacterium]
MTQGFKGLSLQAYQPLYSVAETLALIKIGRTKFYKEIAQGRIKVVKCGQKTLVTGQAIQDWIEALPRVPSKTQQNSN